MSVKKSIKVYNFIFVLASVIGCEIHEISLISYTFDKHAKVNKDVTITVQHSGIMINVDLLNNTKLCNEMFNITERVDSIVFYSYNVEEIETELLINVDLTGSLEVRDGKIKIIKRHTFKNLKTVSLSITNCSIEIIENEAFVDLNELTQLHLWDNFLTRFNPASFKNLPQLEFLQCDHNKITALEKHSFEFLTRNSTECHFSFNRIRKVDRKVFNGLTVEYLSIYLEDNLINDLPVGIFEGHTFAVVDLRSNTLKKVSEKFFQSNFKIQEFVLSFSYLYQDTLMKFVSWSVKNNITLVSSSNKKAAGIGFMAIIFISKVCTIALLEQYKF
ncbi:hypothetical protein Zmor_018438 [Zophobas morio]|uniref:Uncharacterized protein n=1 Tax=Zophobas morio TaxID=2755281 RepID=A0AA38MDI6_9CUCU|nr:hypothetical protein Zmor_018438 [Zophobas morio]